MDKVSLLKQSLRDDLRKKRAALSLAFQKTASESLSKHELPFLAGAQDSRISFYMPKGAELDPRPLCGKLVGEGHSLCLPVVEKNSKILSFRAYQNGDLLRKGEFDILEPSREQPIVTPQIIFVPLLGVDLNGNRLGYGSGYFDQTLASLQKELNPLAIGLSYEVQIVDEVPCEDSDIPLDWLMTEDRVIRF